MKIALLYYNIKSPAKETLALKVLDFEVSIHTDIDAAHFWAYYHYGLACKENPEVENTPMLKAAWNNRFNFCLFVTHKHDQVYKPNKADWRIKAEAWRLYNAAKEWSFGTDVSCEMSAKIAEYILPVGYNIMESGVITEGCQMFHIGNVPFKDDRFFEYWCASLIGQDIKDVRKTHQKFMHHSTSHKNYGAEIITQNPIIIRPI